MFDQVELHKKSPATNKDTGEKFGGDGGGAFSVEIPAGHKVLAFYGGFGGDIHNIGVYTTPISDQAAAASNEPVEPSVSKFKDANQSKSKAKSKSSSLSR